MSKIFPVSLEDAVSGMASFAGKLFLFFFIPAVYVFCPSEKILAAEISYEESTGEMSYQEEMLEELELDEISDFLKGSSETEKIDFYQLVKTLVSGDDLDYEEIKKSLIELFFGNLSENRELLLEILLMVFVFSMLKTFTEVFSNTYISEISFFLVYGILMLLLMRSFLSVKETAEDAMIKILDFMKMMVPVFGATFVFSAQNAAQAGFSQLVYLLVFVIQNILLSVVLPLILSFVLIQFLNYVIEGEKFSRLSELVETGINWCLRFLTGLVVGINLIQGMLKPALDRLKTSAWTKTLSMIPGIGNSLGTFGEIFLSSGMVIKNSVGVAGILVLAFLTLTPLVKIFALTFCYKVIAAVCEPMADKRISGCINGVYRGSVLALKLLFSVMLLFVLTIAITTAAGSFIN